MKNLLLLVFTFSSLMLSANGTEPAPTTKKVNTETSKVVWTGKKVTGSHTGTIAIKEGTLDFENGILSGGAFTIDMTTIVCTDLDADTGAKLVGHLSSDDFFGVPNHETATLKITKVTPSRTAGTYSVTGDLTIKGITHIILFDTVIKGNQATAALKIDRTKYDIKYGSGSFFDGLGDKMIYDDFDLDLKLNF